MALELADSLESTTDDRLAQAEAMVRAYCGWHIAPQRTVTVTLRGDYQADLLLPSLHVTAVSSVVRDGTTLAPDDDYTWTDAGVLSGTGLGCWYSLPVEVTFTHGYADVPEDVTAVVQAVARRAVDNPGSMVRRQVGPFAATYSQTGFNQSLPIALMDAEKEILDHYRIPGRP